MKKYKAIFCDIDGTLLTDDKKLLPETLEAVKRIKEKKIPFILVSARLPQGIESIQDQLKLQDAVISYGGSLIYDKDGEILFEKGISIDLVKDIEKIFLESGLKASFNFYSGSNWFTSDLSHPLEQLESQIIGIEPLEAKVEDSLKEKDIIHKCMFIGIPEVINELEIIMKSNFNELNVAKSSPILLEITNKDTSKSESIRFLCEKLKLNPSEIIAIGDNFNDKDMLEIAGLPIVMGNAPDLLKEMDRAIVTKDNNSNGVGEALDFILRDINQG